MITEKVKKFIFENRLIAEHSRVFLAVSGGVDSVVMSHILYSLRDSLDIQLAIGHVNHSMRVEESDKDELFTAEFAKKLGLEFYSAKLDPENWLLNGNKQELARKLRYDNLFNWLYISNSDYLATAHHANDQMETFIERLFRGSGIDGLSAIPVKRDQIIRPILCLSREEIETYAKEHNLLWREDKSNKSTKYFRNKLRSEVIPVLNCVKSDSLEQINKAVVRISEAKEALNFCATEKLEQSILNINETSIRINTTKIRILPVGLRIAIWRKACKKLIGTSLYGFLESHWRSIDRIVMKNVQNSKLDLPDKMQVTTEKDVLVLSIEKEQNIQPFEHELSFPGKFDFNYGTLTTRLLKNGEEKLRFSYNQVFFDLDELDLPITLRNTKKGDLISLPNLGYKKVSRVFSDCHIPQSYRMQIPVLVCKNEVLWIAGLRRSSHATITEQTRSILGIKYQPKTFKLIGGRTVSVLE